MVRERQATKNLAETAHENFKMVDFFVAPPQCRIDYIFVARLP